MLTSIPTTSVKWKKLQSPGFLIIALVAIIFSGCKTVEKTVEVEQWTTHELTFNSDLVYANGYTEQDVWVQFVNDKGDSILRPGFWDGGNTWRVRFAPIDSGRTWTWVSFSAVADKGLAGKKGSLQSVPYKGSNEAE